MDLETIMRNFLDGTFVKYDSAGVFHPRKVRRDFVPDYGSMIGSGYVPPAVSKYRRTRGNDFPWTPALEAKLVQMRAEWIEYREIAKALGTTAPACRSRMNKIRKRAAEARFVA